MKWEEKSQENKEELSRNDEEKGGMKREEKSQES